MERRDFLKSTAAAAGVGMLPRVRAFGQPPVTRAAVVIGVNRAAHLPVLGGAASDAIKIANWLHDEGFATRVFVDEPPGAPKATIRANDIDDAVAKLIEPGTLEQLVIYFSGHGFVKNG